MPDGTLRYSILADASQLMSSVDGAISKIGGLGLKVAGLATGAAVFGGLAAAIKGVAVAANFEQAQISFTTLIGNAERAKAALAQLKQFANVTPFEFGEIQQSAIALLNAGIPAESLVKHLTALGNAASVTGGSITEIAQALSKAMNAGQLTAEVMDMFTFRGVNAYKLVADQIGVTTEELRTMMGQGVVRSAALVEALQKVYGATGQFGGLMQEQSRATLGLLSTLKDAVNDIFLAFGTPINDAIKPILAAAINLAGELRPVLAGLGMQVARIVTAMHGFIANASQGGGVVAALGSAIADAFGTLASYGRAVGAVLITAGGGFAAALVTAATPVFQWLAAKVDVFAAHVTDSVATALADALDELPLDIGHGAADSLQDTAHAARLKALDRGKDAENVDFKGAGSQAMGELASAIQLTVNEARAQIGALQGRASAMMPPEIAGPPAFLKDLQMPAEAAGQALVKVAAAADKAAAATQAEASAQASPQRRERWVKGYSQKQESFAASRDPFRNLKAAEAMRAGPSALAVSRQLTPGLDRLYGFTPSGPVAPPPGMRVSNPNAVAVGRRPAMQEQMAAVAQAGQEAVRTTNPNAVAVGRRAQAAAGAAGAAGGPLLKQLLDEMKKLNGTMGNLAAA